MSWACSAHLGQFLSEHPAKDHLGTFSSVYSVCLDWLVLNFLPFMFGKECTAFSI